MPAAVAIPSIIGAGTSIIGGALGASASKKAAAIQQQMAGQVAQMDKDAAAQAQKYVGEGATNANTRLDDAFHQQTANLNPYLAAGEQGVNSLASMLAPGGELTKQFSFSPSDFQNDPGFKFLMDQGNQAIQRSAAATGSLGTGGTLKALTQYSQGLADTKYGEAYNRALQTFQTNRNNTLGGMQMLIGVGQNATGQFNNAAQNWGNLTSNNTMRSAEYSGDKEMQAAQLAGEALTGGANAKAAGTVGSANAWSQALGGVGNAAGFAGMMSMMPQPQMAPTGFMPYNSAPKSWNGANYYGGLPNLTGGGIPGTDNSNFNIGSYLPALGAPPA